MKMVYWRRLLRATEAQKELPLPTLSPLDEFLREVAGQEVKHTESCLRFTAEAVVRETRHKPARVFCRPLLPGTPAAYIPAAELQILRATEV